MQAELDGNSIITYHAINAKQYNVEDIMSIPTSLTKSAPVASVVEEVEFAYAA